MIRRSIFPLISTFMFALFLVPEIVFAQNIINANNIQTIIPPPPFTLADVVKSVDAVAEHCQSGRGARNSEICAQWSAADAAWHSAIWIENTFWLGGAGILVGLFTLIAASFAAFFAKNAAEAARHGNQLAIQSFADEQRPWLKLNVQGFSLKRDEEGIISGNIAFEIENVGKSPALRTKIDRTLLPISIAFKQNIQDEFFDESLIDDRGHPIKTAGINILPGEIRKLGPCGVLVNNKFEPFVEQDGRNITVFVALLSVSYWFHGNNRVGQTTFICRLDQMGETYGTRLDKVYPEMPMAFGEIPGGRVI